MNKKRLFNLASLIINMLIIYFTIDAVWYNFRGDVTREGVLFGISGWDCLRFFTVLSNMFVAIAAAIILCYNIRNVLKDEYVFPKWAMRVKFSATVAVTVTLLTVILFLGPLQVAFGNSYFSLFGNNNLFLHLITPVLAIITLLFFERTENFEFKNTWLGLIPTVLYSILYVVMVVIIGEENGGWMDFYGFTFGGNLWVTPFSLLIMYADKYAFSVGEWFLQKKIIQKIKL
ncbi:MAG: hypothetical protein J6Z36_02190 [Clostridia bacterium]|nr:hypothetical protein [Clostridia bacterium]